VQLIQVGNSFSQLIVKKKRTKGLGPVWFYANACHVICGATAAEANKMAATVVARITECMEVGILWRAAAYSQTK